MPTISDFVKDFMTKQDVRCPVLKNHNDGLGGYGLSSVAVNALGTMQLREIVPVLLAELTGYTEFQMQKLVDDLEAKRLEVNGASPYTLSIAEFQRLAAAGAYNADGLHIFEVSRLGGGPIRQNQQNTLVLRGNGFDHATGALPRVRFVRPETEPFTQNIEKDVATMACDVDLNERANVAAVSLPEMGDWWVHIKNPGGQWAQNHKGKNKIHVVAP